MLGVFRPDQQVFGEQLDALLLMPPEALTRQHTQILDVAALDGGFWVIMGSATGDRALYRFDADWQAQQSSDLDAGFTAPYLVTWQDRLLVADPSQRALLRYAADGREEAALRPELLDARWQQWRNAQGLAERGRAAAIAAALLLCLPTLAYALLQGLLYRYLPAQRLTATAILDPIPAGVHWVPPHAGRRRQLRNLATLLVLLPTVMAALLYLGSGDSAALAALPALGGALIAARLLRRGLGGYCGLLPERLIAVDFDGRYCFGTRDRLRGNDHTLLFGQVAVPLRISGLDNLDSQPLSRPGAPLHIPSPSPAGEIAAQMLLQRHPWALAALWLSGGWIATLVLLTAAALLS